MSLDKIGIKEDVKEFKQGLERIRREEALAEELRIKMRKEAKEIISGANKRAEEIFEERKARAEKEKEELIEKSRREANASSKELKLKAEESKEKLARLTKANFERAVELVLKKIMG